MKQSLLFSSLNSLQPSISFSSSGIDKNLHFSFPYYPVNHASTDGSFLAILEGSSQANTTIKIPNSRPHSILVNPWDKKFALIIDQKGHTISILNTYSQKIERVISSEKGRYFYGHGAFLDPSHFLCTEVDPNDEDKGDLFIRKFSSGEIVKFIPTFGQAPHSVVLHSDGLLYVANGGLEDTHKFHDSNTNLSIIDPEKAKLVAQHFPKDRQLRFGHLVEVDNGVVLGGRKALVRKEFQSSKNRGQRLMVEPTSIFSATTTSFTEMRPSDEAVFGKMLSALSLAYSPQHNLVLVSHPFSDLVSCWNSKENKFSHAVYVEGNSPRGIVWSKILGKFIIHSSRGNVFTYSPISRELEKIAKVTNWPTGKAVDTFHSSLV